MSSSSTRNKGYVLSVFGPCIVDELQSIVKEPELKQFKKLWKCNKDSDEIMSCTLLCLDGT